MIIFTEHDEVIVSLKDFRNLIRRAVEIARSAAYDNYPSTFSAESVVEWIEMEVRKDPHSMEVLP